MNIRSVFSPAIFLLPAIFLSGCASQSKKESVPARAMAGVKVESKAQVRDFKNNKTSNLSIDVIAVKNSYLRMEVSATLGYPVASYVLGPQSLKMAIYPQKRFYFGSNSENALRPLLGFPLDPNVLQSIVFDFPIKGWNCETGSDGLVSACKHGTKNGDVVVAWQDRKEDLKRVVIQGPQFEMEWQFKGSSSMNAIKAETFKLDPPSGYKVIPL